MMHKNALSGFTLIELSIVLVIIGLIVGGVLTGRDLIAAANIRAQIAQIEKYNTAVRAFQSKYNCLPGDCKNAVNFGFAARSNAACHGDDNGIITDCSGQTIGCDPSAGASGINVITFGCETSLFWNDLGKSTLIDRGPFNSDADGVIQIASGTAAQYFPPAKLGSRLSILVGGCIATPYCEDKNYFFIEYVDSTDNNGMYQPFNEFNTPARAGGVTPRQGFLIDSKIDDGFPLSGKVSASTIFPNPASISNNANNITGCNYISSYWSNPYSTYPLTNAPDSPGCNLRFEFN